MTSSHNLNSIILSKTSSLPGMSSKFSPCFCSLLFSVSSLHSSQTDTVKSTSDHVTVWSPLKTPFIHESQCNYNDLLDVPWHPLISPSLLSSIHTGLLAELEHITLLPHGLCTCRFSRPRMLFPQMTAQLHSRTSFRCLLKCHLIVLSVKLPDNTW